MEQYTHHESPTTIQAAYTHRLGAAGWQFEQQKWSLATWRSVNTEQRLAQWQESGIDVEMSIVIVPPDGDITGLPVKALGYIASALSAAESLQERHGVRISHLRILSPVHINTAVDGGDKKTKLANAATMARIVTAYARAFHPNLATEIHSDTGNEVTDDILAQLQPAVEHVTGFPHVLEELGRSARQHDERIGEDNDLATRTALYLVAHGPAWGYTPENPLFSQSDVYDAPARIVYAPPSELRFLTLAAETGLISPSEASEVVTLISGKQNYAPYYRCVDEEPTLQNILSGETPQRMRDRLMGRHGDLRVADIITNINMLVTAEQGARRERRQQSPTIQKVLLEALQVA